MASAVFEGTSLVNMFVRGCWVNGIRRLIVSRRGDEEEFFEIRTEWSDRSVLYLHRSFADLGRLWQRLRDAFPEDRPELARVPLRQGLVAIKDAHDIETRLNEVEKLLKTIINMPCKYSRSEVVLTFFERSPLDQVLKNDNVHKIQPSFQSPVKISGKSYREGVGRPGPAVDGRGFPEALPVRWAHLLPLGSRKRIQKNDKSGWRLLPDFHETVFSTHRPTVYTSPISKGSNSVYQLERFENGGEFTSELEDGDDPAAYVTNLSYYHLVPFETDILD
ncbi:PX domain-containing protein 1 [Leptonychotes weddellii]|uniref:PX domain-containing protein 1 n=1 Tax=Leptonychotes weddellii TaxID=9713 RepID=A0A7F8QZB9_LEPWE|nr:PX domain-containing protein 1 [Leptonychotes weddellii]